MNIRKTNLPYPYRQCLTLQNSRWWGGVGVSGKACSGEADGRNLRHHVDCTFIDPCRNSEEDLWLLALTNWYIHQSSVSKIQVYSYKTAKLTIHFSIFFADGFICRLRGNIPGLGYSDLSPWEDVFYIPCDLEVTLVCDVQMHGNFCNMYFVTNCIQSVFYTLYM